MRAERRAIPISMRGDGGVNYARNDVGGQRTSDGACV